MKTCPGCARSVAEVIGQCPFCRHVFPAVEGAKPMLDPELISAAIAAERGPERSGLGQTMLLLLALPVLVPSLIWFWIGAKRWGRVDWVLLAVTGAVLTLFTLGSPLWLAMMLIADACAAALFVLRYPRLDYGIFLGYSNAVAFPLILGGLIGGFGAVVYLPIGPLNQLLGLYAPEERTTPAELAADDAKPGPRAVRLAGAKLARNAAWVARGAAGELARAAATEILDAQPGELWTRRAELAGQFVRLAKAPGVTHTIERAKVPFARSPSAPKEVDGPARLHGPLPGLDARVWLASEPVAPPADEEAQQLKSPRERIGMLVLADTDLAVNDAWKSTGRPERLPGMIALLVPGRPDPTADAGLAAYVPVEGTEDRLWVHFPTGLPADPSVDISGIFDKDFARMQKLLSGVQQPGAPIAGGVRLVSTVSRAEFAEATGLSRACAPRELGTGLILLGLGALFTLVGLVAALRE